MLYTRHTRAILAPCFLLIALPGTAFCGPPNVQAAVPFHFYSREVVVQATVNGQGPYPMLLDSGTNPSVIDLSLARALGLTLTPEGRGGSGGGTHPGLVYQTSLPSVGVGALSAANIDALALDLSALSRRFGHPLRGVLGHSLLRTCIVQFDYPARVVRFLSALPPPGTATRTLLPIRTEDCVQADGILVNGHPVRANMDTGSSSMFQLTPQAVRRLGLSAQARRARPASGAGFNGAYASHVGTVDKIMVGKITVTHPAVTFWMPGTGHDDVSYDINIGNAFLRRAVLTIDYPGRRLALDYPVHP